MNKEPIRVAQIMGKWLGGGVESVVMNYYRHIDRTKIQFDFICDSDSTNIPYEEIESLGGRVILVPPYQKIFKYEKELKKILIDGKYAIVHSHINTLSVFSLWAAKCAGVPIRIAHSHSTTNKREGTKNLIKQVLRIFSKKYATDFFACSEVAGKWLFGDKLFEKGDIYILNNAINIKKFQYNSNTRNMIRNRLNIKNNQIVIGHVGRFDKSKNHLFLISVFAECVKLNSNFVLLLIGQGKEKDNIKNYIDEKKLNNNVIILNHQKEIHQYYQAIDIFCFPSLYEGFGLSLIEAQCSNIPCVVSTNVPKVTKINNNVIFLSLNDSINKWATSILNCKKVDRTKRNSIKMKKAGFDIIFEVNKLEKKYESFIKK